jgi:hypothetical protein
MDQNNKETADIMKDQWLARKSAKSLKMTKAVSDHQKQWFLKLQERISRGDHLAIGDEGGVEEIFTTLDIPIVGKHWWAGAIAAKQMSAYYFNLLQSKGFDECRYCALGLACTLDHNPEKAPWGGLPKPTVIIGGQIPGCECDAAHRITQIWADEYKVKSFLLETTYPTRLYPRWWDNLYDDWDKILEPRRINLRLEELKELIRFLEITTGRTFSYARFREVMELVNEQNWYFKQARDLIAKTVPCPVGLAEQVSVYRAQWHRGTQAGLELTKMFYEELQERASNGVGAISNEKLRLMWIGVGLWHNTAFYQYFEEKYGAIFSCSLYLGLAADGYRRNLQDDPLRALAGRSIFLGLWGSEWQVKEAKINQVDGIVQLIGKNCREYIEAPMTRMAFEKAGIPVLQIFADNVDVREWDDTRIKAQVENFIETRLLK